MIKLPSFPGKMTFFPEKTQGETLKIDILPSSFSWKTLKNTILADFLALRNQKNRPKEAKNVVLSPKEGLLPEVQHEKWLFYLFWKKVVKPLLENVFYTIPRATFSKNRFSFRSHKNRHFTPKTASTVIKCCFL